MSDESQIATIAILIFILVALTFVENKVAKVMMKSAVCVNTKDGRICHK